MSRCLLIIRGDEQRQRAIEWCAKAPEGTRIEFKETKRTREQNDRLWAMLTDIATQKEHAGRKFTPAEWKILFMHAWQKEITLVPSLDGKEIVPLTRTSDLSKREMTELMDFIDCWGSTNSVTFHWQEAA